jgi:hypothetical protein
VQHEAEEDYAASGVAAEEGPYAGLREDGWLYQMPLRDTMKWEYKLWCVKIIDSDEQLEHDLNTLGADGWELVSVTPSVGEWNMFFKRQG